MFTMCELCDEDPKARQAAMRAKGCVADDLRRLADHYDAVAGGRVKPHTEEFVKSQYLAKAVIRRLVEEWV